MIRFFAEWTARRWYVGKEYFLAEQTEMSAKSALYRARETRELIARTTKEADDIEARIKEVEAMQEKGYWECQNGHETPSNEEGPDAFSHLRCSQCGTAGMKLIKRSQMTGQEQYESDKERKEAEKIAENKRTNITEMEKQLENQEQTGKVLMQQAKRNREFAELLRKL